MPPTIPTNSAGVAICSCGGELEIRCTNGCELPDPVFQRPFDPTAICNWSGCRDQVGEWKGGPQPTRCPKHRAMQREYNRRHLAKKGSD